MRQLFFVGGFFALTLAVGYSVSQFPPWHVFLGILALVVFAFVFINAEFGLFLLIFSMLLSPEFVVGATAGGSLDRGVTLRFEDFLLLIIGAGWFARNAVFKELGLLLKTPLNRPMFVYILFCILSTGWAVMSGRVDPKTGGLFVLKYFQFFIVFFMTVNLVRDEGQIRRMVFCLLLTAVIVSVVGILQIPGGGRVSAPFEGETGEPNTFGGYLVFLTAVALGLFLYGGRTRIREATAAVTLIMLPPLLFTLSRITYLALPPALMAVALFSRKRDMLVGVLLILLLISPLLLPSAVMERLIYTFRQPAHAQQIVLGEIRLDTSTAARIVGWRQALGDWMKRPLLGYGVTGYRFIDAQYPRILAETGLLGLTAFLFLMYSVFKMAFQSLRQAGTPFHRGLCIGFIAGTVGLMIHALGANTFIIVRIMEPFWFMAGIVYVIQTLGGEAGQADTVAADELYRPRAA